MVAMDLVNELYMLLYNLGNSVIQLVLAVIIVAAFFVLGYALAKIVNMIIKRALEGIKLEEHIKNLGLDKALMGFNLTHIITIFVKVFIIFAFLGAAAEVINISFFSKVVSGFLNYLPSLAQGVAVIVGAMFISTYIVNYLLADRQVRFSQYISVGFKVFVMYMALILALPLVMPNVNTEPLVSILTYLLLAMVIAVGLATGLALGLGLKEPIEKAALKNQDSFDEFFGKIIKKR